MRRSVLFAALLLSTPAAAEGPDAKETRLVQARFGECVVKLEHKTARQFVLTTNLDERKWSQAIGRIATTNCLSEAIDASFGVQMKFPGDTMRYALADALVRREFASGPVPLIDRAAPLEQPKFEPAEYQPKLGQKLKGTKLKELDERRTKRLALIFLADFGECVVRGNPVGSHGVLMTMPESPQESAALKAMVPDFGKCFPAGQQFAFNKSALRGTLAMNYYRLAHAPRVAATTAGASK